jgi:hypothetical protein
MGVSPVDLLTRYSFRCPRRSRALRRADDGLGSGLSLHPIAELVCNLGAARLVSTPSRPEAFSAGLGSGLPFYRLPRL